MPRRRLALLLAVVGVAVVVLVVWSPDHGGLETEPADDAQTQDDTPSPASAQGTHEGDDGGLPSLIGRATEGIEEPVPDHVEILVLGRGEVPLPKAHVTLLTGGSPVATGWTGVDGRVSFPADSHDASLWIQVRAPATVPGSMYYPRTLTASCRTVRIASGIQIDGRVVDADTGRAIEDVAWALRIADPSANRDWPPSGQMATCFHEKGDQPVRWPLRLRTPDGYVADDPKWLEPFVSRYAQRLAFRYPLRREARVRVEVRDASGARVEAPVVITGRGHAQKQPDADGNVVLEGIPYYAGMRIHVLAVGPRSLSSWPDPFAKDSPLPVRAAYGEAVLPRTSSETCIVPVHLPAAPRSWRKIVMWADSLVEPHVRILHTIDRSVVAGEGLVQVQAARQDGTPAAYAAVEIGLSIRRADMNGRALFPNIAFGSHEVCLLEPGLVFTTTRFQHLEGADTWVSVRERDGATLRVRAVDGTGGALPYALLDLVPTYPSGVAAGRRLPPVYWEDEDRTTQRLDGFTDEIGTRCFLHLDPMPTTIHARWGDLAGDTTVQLVEDRTTDVEIVLKEPE